MITMTAHDLSMLMNANSQDDDLCPVCGGQLDYPPPSPLTERIDNFLTALTAMLRREDPEVIRAITEALRDREEEGVDFTKHDGMKLLTLDSFLALTKDPSPLDNEA